MATTKKFDIAVKTGSYVVNGETKNRYMNIGAMMQGDNGPFILLDPMVNLAAAPREPGKDRVICSLFEPRDNAAPGGAQAPQRQAAPQRAPQPSMADDDIPF